MGLSMGKNVKKIWNIITSIIVALAIILAIALVGVRLIGLQVFTVLSGSMEPTYQTGSLIYVKSIDAADIEVGTPLTFVLDEHLTVATHRVVEVHVGDDGFLRFSTKGDANDAVDGGTVHEKNVLGTPIFTIPKLGYLASYIQSPPGMYVAISVGAILLLLVFLPDLFESDDKQKKGKRTQEHNACQEKSDESSDSVSI